MISNSQLVEKLRELGFHFDTSSRRAQTYKQGGGSRRVTFNTRDWYLDGDAKGHVCSAGMDHSAAAEWVKKIAAMNLEAAKPASNKPASN